MPESPYSFLSLKIKKSENYKEHSEQAMGMGRKGRYCRDAWESLMTSTGLSVSQCSCTLMFRARLRSALHSWHGLNYPCSEEHENTCFVEKSDFKTSVRSRALPIFKMFFVG